MNTIDQLMDALVQLKREYQRMDNTINTEDPEYQRRLDQIMLAWKDNNKVTIEVKAKK